MMDAQEPDTCSPSLLSSDDPKQQQQQQQQEQEQEEEEQQQQQSAGLDSKGEGQSGNNSWEYQGFQHYNADSDDDAFSAAASCTLTVASLAEGIAHTFSHWKVLMFGQLLALSMSGISASATTLVRECSVNAPTFQFGLLYLCLLFHFVHKMGKYYWLKQTGKSDAICKKDDGEKGCASDPLTLREDDLRGAEDARDHDQAQAQAQQRPVSGPLTHTLPCTSVPLHGPWWFYFVIAVLDVEANFFTILAFRYTTLTSVTLFDCLAIPSAMVTSKWILGSRYHATHLLGAGICILGVILNVVVDYEEEMHDRETGEAKYPHKLLGDVLAIAGGILYGVNDGLEELVVKRFSMDEFLAMTGLYGSIICAVQIYILELDAVAPFFDGTSSCTQTTLYGLLIAFVFLNYVYYVGTAKFLVVSEAALMNLSLLTSDLYSVLFSVFAQKIVPAPFFFLALVLIVSGVVVYEIGPSPMVTDFDDITIGGPSSNADKREKGHDLNIIDVELPGSKHQVV